MKRVVITGQGTVNPLGNSVAKTLEAFKKAQTGIGPLVIRDIERLSVKIAAQVHGFSPKEYFDRQEIALYDRFTQFAVFAAREAIEQSGLTFNDELALRSGIVLGTAGGGIQTQDDNYRAVYEDGKNRVHPFVVPRLMHNAAASQLSMIHNLQGPVFTVSTACASSNHAMGQAFSLVRSGISDVVLTGGSESMLCFGGVKAWEALRVMSSTGCRPFCSSRDGMVQGEGAAIFVFEEYDHAKARGAEILAEVAGFSMTSDASHVVIPSRHGAGRAISGALKDAGLNTGDVGYINAHGTGTVVNDKTESGAIADVFAADCADLLVSSTKSMHGHLIGGTGAVELLACIMALQEGIIAPTIGYQTPDPDCPLNIVPNEAREAKVTATLSNAFAFGGLNAVLALKAV